MKLTREQIDKLRGDLQEWMSEDHWEEIDALCDMALESLRSTEQGWVSVPRSFMRDCESVLRECLGTLRTDQYDGHRRVSERIRKLLGK